MCPRNVSSLDDVAVSIVVPTFRRPDALRECLASIVALDFDPRNYEVVVVNDGGDDATELVMSTFRGDGVRIRVERQHQRGAATARNRGARVASGELVLFCDDDIVLRPSHLTLHLEAHQRHGPRVLVNGAWEFAPTVLASLGQTPFGRYRIQLERQFQAEAAGAPCEDDPACLRMQMLGSWDLSLRRDLFWTIGGFDEAFPVAGAEDQDFSLRASEAGGLLLLDTRIRCLHNDNRLTLQAYCEREERSASTMPFLARKYPAQFGDGPYVRENRPALKTDPPGLMVKKLFKRVLSAEPVLRSLHTGAGLLERARLPERLLRGCYSTLLGLHLFRGFRRSWSS